MWGFGVSAVGRPGFGSSRSSGLLSLRHLQVGSYRYSSLIIMEGLYYLVALWKPYRNPI